MAGKRGSLGLKHPGRSLELKFEIVERSSA